MQELTNLLDQLAKKVFGTTGFRWTSYNKFQFEKLACEYESFQGVAAFSMDQEDEEHSDCYKTLHIGNTEGEFPKQIWTSHTKQRAGFIQVLKSMGYGMDGLE